MSTGELIGTIASVFGLFTCKAAFVTAVRRSIIAEKATMQRVPLPKFSKNCIVTQDYRNVVTELLKDMEG